MKTLQKLKIRWLSADVTEPNNRVDFGFHENKVFDMIIDQPQDEMMIWDSFTEQEQSQILDEMIYVSKNDLKL